MSFRWPGLLRFVTFILTLPMASGRGPEILVRAESERPRKEQVLSPDAEARQKVFVVVAGKAFNKETASSQPLDQEALTRIVARALTQQGFREAGPGEHPGILVMFQYGAGYLKNPYLDQPGVLSVMGGHSTNTPGVVMRIFPDFNRAKPFRERRLQEADLEKLFILVNAYDFDAAARQNRRKLWSTTINVNARGNDLAQLFDKMIFAAAPFFGERVEEEVEASVPRGQVDIGDTEIMDD